MPMTVQCELCPKRCLIDPGQSGECRIRVNLEGRLTAVTYGHPCSVNVDPVEKKPLFHFLPSTPILSLATVGCNLHCKNCQNWEISQANPEDQEAYTLPPEDLPGIAQEHQCRSIAYTYSEPVVYYEYTLDSCLQAKKAGLRNVLVTAGYLNPDPWKELCLQVDAANINLKALSDTFYREICGATLQPVLDNIIMAKTLGVWVEVTNLVIPTLNDSDEHFREIARWVKQHLGNDTPLHFTRFFPQYRMRNLPSTPSATLERARQIALAEGIHFVYVGNVTSPEGENTYCPACHALLIQRHGFRVAQNNLEDRHCSQCQTEIAGIWI
jgi:pyruvate formate lyase activating enzyme